MRNYCIFKNPYVLIEDAKNKYSAIYKEYKDKKPCLNLSSARLTCPFADKIKYSHKKSARPQRPKAGYCETCFTHFKNYAQHILEEDHREFSYDEMNYNKVDFFIKEINEEIDYFPSDIDFSDLAPDSPCSRYTQGSSVEMCSTMNVNGADFTKESYDTIIFSRISGNSSSCYDSYDKITTTSANKIIRTILQRTSKNKKK
ncbi:hypothetical protein EDEG_01928 [Edhazardia aedis USNM 41457]|uniref:DBF4-type domain-containing protein n=1 Tax=Edhazardia aedis (strain USNM 41457) TaxID=1003232 RepID=J9DR11_EDHAE|nr:hypothetical protein EDEG_01928 [Edhazardia aedis USNM 41457]|eukprot:EJW03772.1 hypothetical protein EDEG_01928 [Edhazardia aedis USNM 41457]